MRTHQRLTASVVLVLFSCAHPQPEASPRSLYDQVDIGMSRADVEALLGEPVSRSFEDEAWYLPPPQLEPAESPYAPGTIGMRFTPDGRVASKRLNPQFRPR